MWAWPSTRPGTTALPLRSMTRVAGAVTGAIASRGPTAAMRSPAIAMELAIENVRSTVMILPLVSTTSAGRTSGVADTAGTLPWARTGAPRAVAVAAAAVPAAALSRSRRCILVSAMTKRSDRVRCPASRLCASPCRANRGGLPSFRRRKKPRGGRGSSRYTRRAPQRGRIAPMGLSRFGARSDFVFSIGVFQNEKAPQVAGPQGCAYRSATRRVASPLIAPRPDFDKLARRRPRCPHDASLHLPCRRSPADREPSARRHHGFAQHRSRLSGRRNVRHRH